MPSEMEREAGQPVSPRKVLLADDDDDQRYLLSRVLQRAGFVTIAAETGGQVVPLARDERPDVILIDVQMPDQDGFTTVRQLKNDPALADIPIIFLTGRLDAGDRIAGLDLGADDFLPKSIDARELVRRVQHASDRRRSVCRPSP
jgi:DNA-binding response OmpR family regulator